MLRRHVFGPLDSLRREFVRPGKNHCDRRAEQEKDDHQPHTPVRNFKKWKRLRRDLDKKPRHDPIGDRYFVDASPLELREKSSGVHSLSRKLVSCFRGVARKKRSEPDERERI